MREESKTKRRSCVEINENKKNLEFNKHGRVVVTINKSQEEKMLKGTCEYGLRIAKGDNNTHSFYLILGIFARNLCCC